MLALFAAMHSYVIQAGDQDVIKELVTVYAASVWEKNRDGMDAWDVSVQFNQPVAVLALKMAIGPRQPAGPPPQLAALAASALAEPSPRQPAGPPPPGLLPAQPASSSDMPPPKAPPASPIVPPWKKNKVRPACIVQLVLAGVALCLGVCVCGVGAGGLADPCWHVALAL